MNLDRQLLAALAFCAWVALEPGCKKSTRGSASQEPTGGKRMVTTDSRDLVPSRATHIRTNVTLTQPAFFISGEVIRPGSYAAGSNRTLMQAIGVAGGLTKFADGAQVQVHGRGGQTDSYD